MIKNLHATKLRTFVPSRDYSASRKFYKDIGFTEEFSNSDLTVMIYESCEFYLQNFFNLDMANNFMMALMVDDVDSWWTHLESLRLSDTYSGVVLKPPQDYPWGFREVHLIDPAGVCWHIATPIKPRA